MKNLIILLMLFAIGCPSLFGQEMPYSSRIDKIFYRYPHDVYAMKYPLRILEGRIFDYHTVVV